MMAMSDCHLMYGDGDGDGDEENTLPPHSEYQLPLALLGSSPTYTLPAQKVIKRGKKKVLNLYKCPKFLYQSLRSAEAN